MDRVNEFVYNWYLLALWALRCLWEEITGQEVSCPDCWKCHLMRWIMLIVITTITFALGVLLWKIVT